MAIRAVPTWYRGTRFRSTLEADWAATFDSWSCRHHFQVGKTPNRPWLNGGELLWSGDARFIRAPRRQGAA